MVLGIFAAMAVFGFVVAITALRLHVRHPPHAGSECRLEAAASSALVFFYLGILGTVGSLGERLGVFWSVLFSIVGAAVGLTYLVNVRRWDEAINRWCMSLIVPRK